MSDDQRDIIRHALGLDYPHKCRRGRGYRNYYCGSNPEPSCEPLVSAGLMRPGHVINDGKNRYYFVTEAGAKAVGGKLPKDDE